MADSPGALKDLTIITGFSGAGKSTAMNVFEDAGYFCVDNLPPGMIGSLIELFVHEGSKVERAAVVSDVRGGEYFEALQAVLDDLENMGLAHRVLFLDAEDETLLNRYKETRRRHPLAPGGSIADGIAAERAQLDALKQRVELGGEFFDLADRILAFGGGHESHYPSRVPGVWHRAGDETLPISWR